MTDFLFDDFDEVSAKAWKQKIQFDLKGADYNNTLIWHSLEDIAVKPFYHADETANSLIKPAITSPTWTIGQHIFVADDIKSNEKALDIINRGAESIYFTLPTADIDITKLLENIDCKKTVLYFNLYFLDEDFVSKLTSFLAPKNGLFYILIDPIGKLGRSGNWYFNLNKDKETLAAMVSKNNNTPLVSIDMQLYQNAGANMVQQLAYGLSHANEYLHLLNTSGSDLKKIAAFTFKVASGGNYFFEIAKLKALRLLWKTIAKEYNIDIDCHIIATPSKRNKTLYDYNVNMLRTTTECMSAVLGGANTVYNLPYDVLYHKDNEFGERIARNQLLILKEESYFDKVNNPTDGSYYIENLTLQLAEKALKLFKEIEASGGFLTQLKSHKIQQKIKESALKEQKIFNSGDEILVGTNKYQNSEDQMKQHLDLYPFVKMNARKTLIEPIIEKRLAESVEQKRLEDE